MAVQTRPLTLITGLSRSMSMPLIVSVAEPPSTAWIVRVTDWSLPLWFSEMSAGQSSTSSEPCGLQMNQMSTGVWYQPDFDFGNVDSTRAPRIGSLRTSASEVPV